MLERYNPTQPISEGVEMTRRGHMNTNCFEMITVGGRTKHQLRICAHVLLGLAILCGLPLQDAVAADVKVDQVGLAEAYGDNCLKARIVFEGEIVEGDALRLANAIASVDAQAAKVRSSCYLNDAAADRLIFVDMNSPGGLYTEGWKIAKLFSDYKSVASTYVAKDSYCYSACAIAFLGGSAPGADGAIVRRRIIHSSAKLGFHAPFPVLEDRAYGAEVVKGFF